MESFPIIHGRLFSQKELLEPKGDLKCEFCLLRTREKIGQKFSRIKEKIARKDLAIHLTVGDSEKFTAQGVCPSNNGQF